MRPEWTDWPYTAHHVLEEQAGGVFVHILTDRHYLECHPEKVSDAQSEFNGKECWNRLLMSSLDLRVGRW